jgi:hypothetical protein
MLKHDHQKTVRCSHQLWPGVTCALQEGHVGPHHAPASSSAGCALSWRSSDISMLRHVPRASPPRGIPQVAPTSLPAWAFLQK